MLMCCKNTQELPENGVDKRRNVSELESDQITKSVQCLLVKSDVKYDAWCMQSQNNKNTTNCSRKYEDITRRASKPSKRNSQCFIML